MADMMSTLRGILGDDADGKIQNAMNVLKNSGIMDSGKPADNKPDLSKVASEIENEIKTEPKTTEGGQAGLSPEGLEFINQIKTMVNRLSNTNDKRSDLLRSLRPFMRTQRQQTIDRAIRLMNIGRFAGILGKK